LQAQRDLAEAGERRFQVLDDFGGNLVRRRQQVRVVERVVFEPEDVEIDLVAGDELGMGKVPEAVGLDALVPPPDLKQATKSSRSARAIGRSFNVKRRFVRRS
jgi:hypothetical protein